MKEVTPEINRSNVNCVKFLLPIRAQPHSMRKSAKSKVDQCPTFVMQPLKEKLKSVNCIQFLNCTVLKYIILIQLAQYTNLQH